LLVGINLPPYASGLIYLAFFRPEYSVDLASPSGKLVLQFAFRADLPSEDGLGAIASPLTIRQVI
jgi:hypothetical protein